MLPEQRKIADILDTVDAAIRQTEATLAKLQQMKQGLLRDLLTRGIDENGELRDPVRHPEQFKDSPLGRIPKVWNVQALGETCQRSGGFLQTGPFGSQLHSYEYVEEGVPVVMPQDIIGGEISEAEIARITDRKGTSLARHRLQQGDVVFARRGDLGRSAYVREREVGWLCGTGCLLARVPAINGNWLAAVHRHDIGQRQVHRLAVGSTMVNLNTSVLARMLVPVPPGGEQEEAVSRQCAFEARVREEVRHYSKLLVEKQGLMDDLLTGRVRVAV